MKPHQIILLVVALLAILTPARAQHSSSVVYDSVETRLAPRIAGPLRKNAWGANILLSTNGFGLGTFYHRQHTRDFASFVDLSISEAKDDQEVEYYNPYTGQTFVPGKINRFLMFPLIFGVEKRLFEDQILDNFRPYIDGGVGPTMIFVFPYNDDYFTALGKGQPKYTVSGYVGVGAYFGGDDSNVMGINMRYYYIPYPNGLESYVTGIDVTRKNQFGGFYITLHFGSAW